MLAGGELDALVAERVMGWTNHRFYPAACLPHGGACPGHDDWFAAGREDGLGDRLPAYGTDIAAAWAVVEKMRANGWVMNLDCASRVKQRPFNARFFRDDESGLRAMDYAETAQLAISRAALKAVGVEVPCRGM